MSTTHATATPQATGRVKALHQLLAETVRQGASDLHLTSGLEPRIRTHGELLPMEGAPILDSTAVLQILTEALPEEKLAAFRKNRDTDLAYEMSTSAGDAISSRFRVNLFMENLGPAAVFRVIPTDVVPLSRLDLLPIVKKIASTARRGMIVVTGVTGSGKSTTTSGIVDDVNDSRACRIITMEDPIEYVHKSKLATVSQREIGRDTVSFSSALKHVLRQDPDVIFIGELRDPETIETALKAADTGHLVIATLHTQSAKDTIGRIVGEFPAEARDRIQNKLASVLTAIISQTLVPKIKGGRVVAMEVMIPTDGIRNSIRMNKPEAIDQAMTDRSQGSIRLDSHLEELYRAGIIQRKHALDAAIYPDKLSKSLGSTF